MVLLDAHPAASPHKGHHPMHKEHPFEIGKSYENENGAYTVLSISPPRMLIQYADGATTSATIRIQKRIWRRMQIDREMADAAQRKGATVVRASVTFTGLEESDFKKGIEGTSWRGREALGGLVSRRLSERMGQEFVSLAIYPQSRFFVYPPHLPMNKQEDGVKLPKFEVRLNAERLRYSFHIEKSDRPMGDDWYWPRFLQLLSEPYWQESIAGIMAEHELYWLLHFEEGHSASGEPLPEHCDKIAAFGDGQRFATSADFLTHLHNLAPRQWCNLYIAAEIPKAQAIALGVKVSEPISHTFNALAPMFLRLLR